MHEARFEKSNVLRYIKINRKRRLQPKFNIKNVIKSSKKPLTAILQKHPRVTREHTDFDKYPYKMTCPNCLSYIITDTRIHNTLVTHSVAACLFPVCLCMLPYCTDEFKDTTHYCPNCKIYLGTKFGAGRKLCRFLKLNEIFV
ncbi:lipopolysaccharide-induced tumor necrosis factor-alpha factor homolog isoform X2 [Osmia lignaria lignaria]|uniref:lipopolysaccharide-induced tumor necrosis factor-alpha factor homolog isoform X2 n=1 Tax=Osmia lignaria lignaria TaxID=1437193 RepID=UPI0014790B90|nr:uncharacterized protein LOC117604418 isoform X2 [Osmia lignaria]